MNKDPMPLIDPDDDADWEFDDDKWEAPKAARDEPAFRDPRAIHTSLKHAVFGGEACVELYAHGDKYSDEDGRKTPHEVLMARMSRDALTMFPLDVREDKMTFLEPKYFSLRAITVLSSAYRPWGLPDTVGAFEELLAKLPPGFSRQPIYGLGFKWEYRLIPEAIEEVVGVTELVIERGTRADLELPYFRLGMDRFESIRRSLDRIKDKARARALVDRGLVAFNETLHVALPDQYPRRFPEFKPGEIYELVQMRARQSNREVKDGLAAARVVRDDAKKIAIEEPQKLYELKATIEQVTLGQLIEEFEAKLQQKLQEGHWQKFFKANPFILGLAFPHPVILLQDQAYVGGTTINGRGESIVDFLMAQQFSGNLAVIEIKRPSTPLVELKPYRGDLHAPHRELAGGMAQVLEQKSQLLDNFAAKRSQSPSLEQAQISAVNCILVVGTMPEEPNHVRSLELFRHAAKDVAVVTFDELLAKLKVLHRLMSANDATPATSGDGEAEDNPL